MATSGAQTRSTSRSPWIPEQLLPRLGGVLFSVTGLFLLLAFLSYHPTDLEVLSAQTQPGGSVRNIGGVLGAWAAFLGRGGFGWAAFLLPTFCALAAMELWAERPSRVRWPVRLVALVAMAVSGSSLIALSATSDTQQTELGGVLGYLAVRAGTYYLGAVGTGLLAGAIGLFAGVLALDQLSFPQSLGRLFSPSSGDRDASPTARPAAVSKLRAKAKAAKQDSEEEPAAPVVAPRVNLGTLPLAAEEPSARIRSTVAPKPKSPPTPAAAMASAPKVRQAPGGFQLPSTDLLTTPPPHAERQLGEDLQVNARILVETLREFGIDATCVNIDRGPSVTRYELSPAPGVKITKIVSLADDLALVLKAASCHIVAPIPGKGLVGVEVPNSTATVVYLKELLVSREFQQVNSPLAMGIGKDVSGQPVISDLRQCPHLLVAGATGSGKTVFLNSLLTGFLCHASPDEVKFLMIDPKMVELVQFNGIPHLVAPVVTDAKRAAATLQWAVEEMERRYRRLAELGARNIAGYNQKAPVEPNEQGHGRMSYLVIVIDELADLMMVSSREVEESITRLSQMSRAVGIHIILATQRPSVDVITGVIKANFPARIAFQVSAKVDSRTILDVNGADKLLGRGDMLFLRPGTAKPIRAQGAMVTDAEIEQVVSHVKVQRQPLYDEQLLNQPDRAEQGSAGGIMEKDELYDMAKELVITTGQASTSLLQRRLRLGYGRAARILDLMEQEGIVGPPQGSRPREVLVGQQAVENRG